MTQQILRSHIVVKLTHEAWHRWPEAPTPCTYLRFRHRHIFHIKCWKTVMHDDREIEIIMFKAEVSDYLKKKYGPDFDTNSCEMIARDLIQVFQLSACEVLEDNENGALLVAKPCLS